MGNMVAAETLGSFARKEGAMDDKARVQALLEKMQAIGIRYSGMAEREQYGFNVFSILREPYEEVGLHSAFLHALLSSDGEHGQGAWFLNTFLEQASLEAVSGEHKPEVFREYTRLSDSGDGSKQRDSIDIYIKAGERAIIVENKIYAGDQANQLCRYVKLALDENSQPEIIDVIYLTLDGHEPEKGEHQGVKLISSGDDQPLRIQCPNGCMLDVKLMSYADDVIPWLNKCIAHMATYPTTRETMVLYQRIVQGLTGQAMNEEENMEIADLLMETPQSFETASKIMAALDKAKAKIQFQFWDDLASELRNVGLKESAIMAEDEKGQKYTIGKIQAFYAKKRNRPWYGIKILLGTQKQHPENQVCFYIEVECNIYYGFIVQKLDGERIRDAKIIGGIQELLKANYKDDNGWPAWRYPQDDSGAFDLDINFKSFEGKALEVIDKDQRKSYLEKFSQEVKEAIQEGVNILDSNGLLIDEKELWDDTAT